eukprot:g139.t1
MSESTQNDYSCEFNSMKDPATERGDSASASSNTLDEVLRELRGLSVDVNTWTQGALLDSFDLKGIAKYVKEKGVKNVICMCGAGISVNAGIPDFRSPETGTRLAEMGIKTPEDIFSLGFFKKDPKPFYSLAKEIMPGRFEPTKTHFFMKLLQDKGMLLRCYTQNIDSLESQAGLTSDKLIAAHGNFDSARCIKCKKEAKMDKLMKYLTEGVVMNCEHCPGVVKPDIVFYGESLPPRFFQCAETDFDECDLLIVMGSSLVVRPFCAFVDHVSDTTPRLLINKEWASGGNGFIGSGLRKGRNNYRDACHLGDCDEGVTKLAELLGLKNDLENLIKQK